MDLRLDLGDFKRLKRKFETFQATFINGRFNNVSGGRRETSYPGSEGSSDEDFLLN